MGLASSCYTLRTWSSTLRKEPRLKVSRNIVLKGIFESKRKIVTGNWRIFQYEKFHDLYFSKNIDVKKWRRWAGNVARNEAWTYVLTGLWREYLRRFNHLEDTCTYGRIILKRILKKSVCRAWTRLIWIKVGTNSGLLWARRRTSRFKKWDEFFLLKINRLKHR